MKTVKATKARMLLSAIAFSFLIISCKKQNKDVDPPKNNNPVDTTKNHGHTPKEYDEIWVIGPTSTSGYTMYDTLKVTNRQEYIANGDSCIMLWGDTALTYQGHKYIPQLLVNLGDATTQLITDGTSSYTVKQITPSANTTIIDLTYGGAGHSNEMQMFIPPNATYVPNTTLVFDRIK